MGFFLELNNLAVRRLGPLINYYTAESRPNTFKERDKKGAASDRDAPCKALRERVAL